MKFKKFLKFLFIILIINFSVFKEDVFCRDTNDDLVSIIIDTSNTKPMSSLFKANIWICTAWLEINRLTDWYMIKKFFKENQVKRIQTGTEQVIVRSKNFEDFKKRFRKKVLNSPFWQFIKNYANSHDTEITFVFYQYLMPKWLSSHAGFSLPLSKTFWATVEFCSPPICYDYKCGNIHGWASIVREIVKILKEELGIKKLSICLGHEPNRDWAGKEESFYKLYMYTAKAVKEYDPTIKVGGIGSWCWNCPKVSCDWYDKVEKRPQIRVLCKKEGWDDQNNKPMIKNFIQYVANYKLPLDFINYHVFGEYPMNFIKQAKTIRKWLRENGFHENVEIYPADWTIWGGPYPADYIDTEKNAAYVIYSLYYMDKAGIQIHGHDFNVRGGPLDLQVIKERNNAEFVGDWAIFTRNGVIKPVYNAFKALSNLYGQRIKVSSTNEDYIIGIGTRNKDKISVIIANYIPIKFNRYFQLWKSYMLVKGYSEYEQKIIFSYLKKYVKSKKYTKKYLKEKNIKNLMRHIYKLIDQIHFPLSFDNKKVKKDLKKCFQMVKLKFKKDFFYIHNSRKIKVTFKNIKAGKYVLKIYTIDRDHSNSCRFNKKTEKQLSQVPCGINGYIDQMIAKAKEEAKRVAQKKVYSFLVKFNYSQKDIHLLNKIFEKILQKEISLSKLFIQKNIIKLNKCKNLQCDLKNIKQELKKAYKIYESAYSIKFFTFIDQINNLKEISLEGSLKTKKIIVDNTCTYTEIFTMQPFSVKLIILEPY